MPESGRSPGPQRARPVLRCAAVGLHLDPQRATSTEALVSSVAALLDRHLADDTEVATLVALPEHTGLLAMLVGERGAAARQRWAGGGSTLEILIALAGGYGEELGALAERYPEVRSPAQLLHLACTDTVVRTLVDGFGQLAADRGIWLSVSAALPRWEMVPPAGDSAEVDRRPVAVPTGPAVRNRQLLLAPDGALAAVHDKVFLVPLEADGDAGLGLEPASLAEVEVAQLPIGRVGTVISKDAWMPDVNERLAQLGAQILLQPEAFDRWAVPDLDPTTGGRDLWPPDKFQRGGWWMLQRHPGFAVNLAPMLLGTLGELSFDGQPLVAVPSPAGDPALGLLGQPPDTGWAAVGSWWRAGGPATAPNALAGPTAGADTIAVAHVELPVRPGNAGAGDEHGPGVARPDTVGASVEVVAVPDAPGVPDASGRRPQQTHTELVPDLVAAEDRVWLAWVACDTAGRQQLLLAAGDGQGWGRAEALSPRPRGPDDAATAGGGVDPVTARRWRPRLAVDAHGPVCVHLGFPAGSWDLFAVRRGKDVTAPVRLDDADRADGVLRERLHDAPTVIADGDALVAVWSDLRWPWVFPQVRVARSRDGGVSWGPSVRADGGSLEGQVDPLAGRSTAETRGQTTPAVAVCEGRLVVAWQERDADGVPGVWLTWPAARGHPTDDTPTRDTPARPRHLARAPAPGQRLARPVLAADGPVVWAVWEVWDADGGARLWVTVSHDAGQRWAQPRAVDQGRPRGARQHGTCLVPTGPRSVTAVFTDDRDGTSTILASQLHLDTDGQVRASPPLRIDDAPPGADARAPTAALLGQELVVVWQDTRTGGDRLRSARLPVDA